jgi:hypothetical protein
VTAHLRLINVQHLMQIY